MTVFARRSRICLRICILLLSFALVSCATKRPEGLICGLNNYLLPDDPDLPFAGGTDELNILVLSAGGEYGAYGAGFMRGWAEVARPSPIAPGKMTVVTGVSTGALLATHAFLGKYEEIDTAYTAISGPQIYKQRSTVALLFSDSLAEASGKDRIIAQYLTHEIIDAVRDEARRNPDRALLIGTVDLDTGEFLRVNMSALAKDPNNVHRDQCFRDVISAASAIPLAFPPKFIDNRMLVDGGLRHYTFINNVALIHQGPDVKRRMFAIYHGDLSAGKEVVADNLIPIAKRTFNVIADQGIKDSAYRLDYVARYAPENRRFETYYADASAATKACQAKRADPSCAGAGAGNEEDMFCQPFMRCLSEIGREAGKAAGGQDKWTRELMTKSLGSRP